MRFDDRMAKNLKERMYSSRGVLRLILKILWKILVSQKSNGIVRLATLRSLLHEFIFIMPRAIVPFREGISDMLLSGRPAKFVWEEIHDMMTVLGAER